MSLVNFIGRECETLDWVSFWDPEDWRFLARGEAQERFLGAFIFRDQERAVFSFWLYKSISWHGFMIGISVPSDFPQKYLTETVSGVTVTRTLVELKRHMNFYKETPDWCAIRTWTESISERLTKKPLWD